MKPLSVAACAFVLSSCAAFQKSDAEFQRTLELQRAVFKVSYKYLMEPETEPRLKYNSRLNLGNVLLRLHENGVPKSKILRDLNELEGKHGVLKDPDVRGRIDSIWSTKPEKTWDAKNPSIFYWSAGIRRPIKHTEC